MKSSVFYFWSFLSSTPFSTKMLDTCTGDAYPSVLFVVIYWHGSVKNWRRTQDFLRDCTVHVSIICCMFIICLSQLLRCLHWRMYSQCLWLLQYDISLISWWFSLALCSARIAWQRSEELMQRTWFKQSRPKSESHLFWSDERSHQPALSV